MLISLHWWTLINAKLLNNFRSINTNLLLIIYCSQRLNNCILKIQVGNCIFYLRETRRVTRPAVRRLECAAGRGSVCLLLFAPLCRSRGGESGTAPGTSIHRLISSPATGARWAGSVENGAGRWLKHRSVGGQSQVSVTELSALYLHSNFTDPIVVFIEILRP